MSISSQCGTYDAEGGWSPDPSLQCPCWQSRAVLSAKRGRSAYDRLLTISKLNWMSNFPVMSFRVKSLFNCSFFLLYTSPSARSFLCSTEVLRLFFPPNRSVCVGVKPVLCDRAGDLPNADEIINTYKDDLPSPELLRQELLRFQIRWNIVNINWLILGYSTISQQIPQMGKWEITVHIVSYFFQILLKTEGRQAKYSSQSF